MYSWQLEPSVIAGIGLVAILYGVTVALPRRCTVAQGASFAAAMAVLFVALQSPIDTLGDRYLLSAHMLQHLLLVLVVPPLLIYGLPAEVVQPISRVPVLASVARVLTRGPVAFGVYNGVFAIAHVPALFDLTLRSQGAHIAEHLIFIGVGVLAWWPVLSPLSALPRLSYPFQMLYLFLQTLPCSLVGALLTLSGDVLYSPYAHAVRVWGTTPIADQQIGGLEMWIGGSLFYFFAFMVVFFLWARHDEQERPRLYVVKGLS